MRLLIAPDSFKTSCTAREVARALRRGAERAAQAAGLALEVRERPLSDGGEGLVEALYASLGGERRRARVRAVDLDAEAPWRQAEWLWVPERRAAFGETAEVVGFQATRAGSPLERTALGIGDYLEAMRAAGAAHIVLGIGGTSTVDGGASVARGLGGRFLDGGGGLLEVRTLIDAARASAFEAGPCWPDVEVTCWADVVTPLSGPRGAVPTFAPQKGATAADVAALQAALERWVALARAATGADAGAAGTGAGGGIPFGVALTLGARIERGAERVTELLDLPAATAWADLVWTGEGRLDQTTFEGKLVQRVLDLTRGAGTPAALLVGQTASRGGLPLEDVDVHALTDTGASLERCLREPGPVLEALAEQALSDWLARRAGVRS